MADQRKRCAWATGEFLTPYHDNEWGVVPADERAWFEFLILEGQQAGLSWELILKRREGYRAAFANFEPARVARFTPAKIERLLQDKRIIRNRLKVQSVVKNAKAFLAVQDEFGSFADYAWRFVDGHPIAKRRRSMKDVPVTTPEAEAMSKELKRRGFKFVGPVICYSLMQATGLVNDHVTSCFRCAEIREASANRR